MEEICAFLRKVNICSPYIKISTLPKGDSQVTLV